ncbi:hypothetical protein ACLIM5_003359 [Vibrio cholerae]
MNNTSNTNNTMTPTDVQNYINPFLVAEYYKLLKADPEKYSRKRYYTKRVGNTEQYIALAVAKSLIDSEV